MPTRLSDRQLAVFAFAAYHELSSGEKVTDVVLRDGAGHAADPDAIEDLASAGLVTVGPERASFTPEGQTRLGQILDAIRTSAG